MLLNVCHMLSLRKLFSHWVFCGRCPSPLASQNMNSKRKAETWKRNRRQLVRWSAVLRRDSLLPAFGSHATPTQSGVWSAAFRFTSQSEWEWIFAFSSRLNGSCITQTHWRHPILVQTRALSIPIVPSSKILWLAYDMKKLALAVLLLEEASKRFL